MRNGVAFITLLTLQVSIVHPAHYAEQYEDVTTSDPEFEDINPMVLMREATRSTGTKQPFVRYTTPSTIITKSGHSNNNLNCNNFMEYAVNCTEVAGMMYGSSRRAPPMADKLQGWCNALIHLTNCASDWNTECMNVADNHFDQYNLEGHIHVVDNVCLDSNFTMRYKDASSCIEDTTFEWEFCYSQFKEQIDEMKNSTLSWTHYLTHFNLCCARASFRACTLEFLFTKSSCTRSQAITMQRFSVIISEGDVHQDCDKNMNYANCPGGDPHPRAENLLKMKGVVQNIDKTLEEVNKSPKNVERSAGNRNQKLLSLNPRLFLLFVCFIYCQFYSSD